jgi:hypothetical protein
LSSPQATAKKENKEKIFSSRFCDRLLNIEEWAPANAFSKEVGEEGSRWPT